VSEQRKLDILLHIACWEMVFGPGTPEFWNRTISDLLARGATLNARTER